MTKAKRDRKLRKPMITEVANVDWAFENLVRAVWTELCSEALVWAFFRPISLCTPSLLM